MKKVWINYWVDMVTGGAFLLCAATGLVFVFFPGLLDRAGGETTILGVNSAAWHWVHDWSGVVMTAVVGLHMALHLRWLVNMTRKLSREHPSGAGVRPQRAPVASPGAGTSGGLQPGAASAAATFATPDAVRSEAAALERPERLPWHAGSEGGRYSRKAFLAGAAAVGGAALLAGIGLRRGEETTTVTQSTSSSGGDSQTQAYGQGYGGAESSGSSSGGSQSGATTTSDRVVVSSSSCAGCGHCLQACPYGVFGWGDGKAIVSDASACMRCGRCQQVCPTSAIALNG